MLGDNNFVSRLRAFDPSNLDEVPHLTLHIARTYLGFQEDEIIHFDDQIRPSTCESHAGLSQGPLRSASAPNLASTYHHPPRDLPSQQQVGLHCEALGALRNTTLRHKHDALRHDPWAAVHAGACLDNMRKIKLSATRPSKYTRPSSKFVVLAPLDLDGVQYASEPCGAVLRWMRSLVLDRAREAHLQLDLDAARKDYAAAEQAKSFAEQSMSEIQAALDANLSQQSCHEQIIATLRRDVARHTAVKNACNADVVANQQCKRGHWFKPAFDITGQLTLTITNLKNSKWWRSRERYKLASPSHCAGSSSESGVRSFGIW